jgi:murein DD-endopeptidase MepM/ murein hydrolase activator NlpD
VFSMSIFNRKIFYRCAFALLSVCFLISTCSAYAASEEELDQLKKERDALVKQRQEQQAVVDYLKQQQADVIILKAALDERNTYTTMQIQLNNDEIALYDQMIEDKSIEVDEAKELENKQLELYRSRVRAMEEDGNYTFIALLLNTSDVGEFLTAMDDIGEIMLSDKTLEDAYIAAREHTEAVRAEYEAYKEEIVAKRDELQVQQDQLNQELEEANSLIADLTKDIESNASILAELAADEQEAETNVANMALALEKQRQAELTQSGGGGGGSAVATGAFTWPVPSCTYITSRFGLRVHPIYGTTKSHTGLDIGAAAGATVVAAAAGTVTMAGVNSGYGNCVMIDHGNGYQTLYGHLASISVTSGSTVSAGQTIGTVGSTGVSTGPHCHFEIFQGGTRIDPEQFFSGLTFSEDAGV